MDWSKYIVLVLAEIEIIFLLASIVLCFGFRIRTIVITCWCLVVSELCLHRAKAFSASHTALSVWRLGVHKEPGGYRNRTVDRKWPKGCPIPCVNCTIKMRELASEAVFGEQFWSVLCFLTFFLISFFLSLIYFFFPIKLSCCQPMSFNYYYYFFPDSLSHTIGEECEWAKYFVVHRCLPG